MEYDPQDYYSDGGEGAPEELPPPQTSGVEKPEAPAKRPKKKLTEAKLEQLRKAREAKAEKRKEKQIVTSKKSRATRKTLPLIPEEESDTEEIVVAPQREKKRENKS